MPKGPLGFPRFNDIGPLTDIPIDQEDLVVNTSTRTPSRGPGWGELEFLAEEGVFGINPAETKRSTFTAKKVTLSTDTDVPFFFKEREDSIIPSAEYGGTYNVGSLQYTWWKGGARHFNSTVGYSRKVDVIHNARRLGIATELKNIMEDDMKDKDVDLIYVLSTTEEGLRLNESLGYEVDEELTDSYLDWAITKDGTYLKWLKKEV